MQHFVVGLKIGFDEVPFRVLPQNHLERDWFYVVKDLMARSKRLYPKKQIEFLYIKEYN